MSVDVAGSVGCEKHHGSAEFLRLSPAASRGSRLDPFGKGLVVDERGVELGGEIAGGDRVDGDAVTAHLGGSRACQSMQPRLRRHIGVNGGAAKDRCNRSSVYD